VIPPDFFQDDLTNPTVGEWPKLDNIVKITRIVVYAGAIIDSVRITYQLKVGGPKTVQHGGNGGKLVLDYTLNANQKLVAVYGRRLNSPSGFGNKNIVQLSFIIGTSGAGGQGPATCQVLTATAGDVANPNTEFDFSWALAGVTSYALQTPGKPDVYLQGLGFTEVLSDAAGPI